MKLLKMKLTNFQGIKDLSLVFPDGRSAAIYGDNATGKTTVYNALTWLLFDKASTAAKNFTPKTKGTDGDIHHLEHSASATFEIDGGQIVTLRKTYKEVYKKKRGAASAEFSGHTVDYAIDEVPTKEKEFTAAVMRYCGGDAEKIKILTMPTYFSEDLPWGDRRRILIDVCGDVSDEAVMASNDELKELPAYLVMQGASGKAYTIDEYRKIAAAQRTEINKKLDEIPGRIDEAERAIPDTHGLVAADIEKKIAALEGERSKAQEEKATIATGGSAGAKLQSEYAELELEIAKLKTAYTLEQGSVTAEYEKKISATKREMDDANIDASALSDRIKRKSFEASRLEEQREKLLAEYEDVRSKRWNTDDNICPTCGRPLEPSAVKEKVEAFNLKKSERLAALNEKGKTECSLQIIEAARKEVEELKEREKGLRLLAESAKQRLEALEENRPLGVLAFECTEGYKALTEKMNAVKAKMAEAANSTAGAVKELDGKISDLNGEIQALRDKQTKLNVAKVQKQRVKELEADEKALNIEYERLEKGLYLCDLFVKAKVAMLTERINDRFTNISFRLFVEQQNGGVKEDCEVMIPTADGRMVPYAFANNAARINAGLDIIDTLSEFWGIEMPVFIDNAESVTKLIKTQTQVIRLIVSESDKALRLEAEDV